MLKHTLLVFPIGYMGEIGFFEATKEIRVINSAESRRIIRGRNIHEYKLVGFTLPEIDPELLATIQVCGTHYTAETGVLQQYFEVAISDEERLKVVPLKGKRDIIHLTFDRDLGLTEQDMQAVAQMFKHAMTDPVGSVVTTIDGIYADVVSINEDAEFRLVNAHIQDDIVYEILEVGKEPQQLVLSGAVDEDEIDGEDAVEASTSVAKEQE